jgi:hypothetical protein
MAGHSEAICQIVQSAAVYWDYLMQSERPGEYFQAMSYVRNGRPQLTGGEHHGQDYQHDYDLRTGAQCNRPSSLTACGHWKAGSGSGFAGTGES